MQGDQKATVMRFYHEGQNMRDAAVVVSTMADDVQWYGVDGNFNRKTYRGKSEIHAYVDAWYSKTSALIFTIDRIIGEPDLIMAEWTDTGTMLDGSRYDNRGVTVFTFVPGTSLIDQVRQYFDFGPLADKATWRTDIQEVAEHGAER